MAYYLLPVVNSVDIVMNRNQIVAGLLIGMAYLAGIATSSAGPKGAGPVHFALADLRWVSLPEFGGSEAIIYRSSDGRRVAAAFKESGSASFVYPFDEFLYVTEGTARVKVHGAQNFVLRKGDVAYFPEGTSVDFDFSKDFADVTMLVADHEVRWR